MTTEEYYSLLREKHTATDWNNRDSIREYNEYARRLRKLMYAERDMRAGPSGVSMQHLPGNALRSDSGAK